MVSRGWTLQELLAPDSVEFFSREGKRLGDKRVLERLIYEITGIPVTALRGNTPIFQFDVKERFSWAEGRQTTREEDEAYSLFGIFDIQMPLLYGEGREKAFKRLREEIDKPLKGLDCLPFATDAPFNSFDRQDEPTCLPNTRVDLLEEIYDWADGQDERCIFWLNGLAGTGKSTISRTIARRYFEQERLGASFFFSRGGGDVSHAGRFFTSIAVQLANNVLSLRQYIYDAITKQKDIASQSLRDQWCQLILRPLSRLGSGSPLSSYVLIIDALDECDKEEHIRIILQLLAEARTLKTVRLRVFLTSRPEVPIRHGFCQMLDADHQDFVLHNISPSIINHDISIFLQHNLNLIAGRRSLGTGWPGEQIVKRLVFNTSGLFIWAATACRFVSEGKRFAAKRLDMILESSSSAINAPEKHLSEIYLTVLRQSISPDYTAEEAEELRHMLKSLLGSIVTLYSPLSTQSLSKLVKISHQEVNQTLDDLYAILDIPKDQTYPLRLHHPSFRDFLLNKERCSDSNFQVDEKQAHQALAEFCIRLLSSSLKQDVCRQVAPGSLVADVESDQLEECLPPEVRYACLYWIPHLQNSNTELHDNGEVHQFLQVHLLHWLEALGWIGKTSEGIYAIMSLESTTLNYNCPRLYAFVHDSKRFVLSNRSGIEQAPLQLYCSALVFAPETSIVRRQFQNCIPLWIQRKPEVQADWSAGLQTLELHSSTVYSVAFSPDGKLVVSGSEDMTIRLWDAVTGVALQTLHGHSNGVHSVAFSPDRKLVVSGSEDMTIRLWDAVTGVVLRTLHGHSNGVRSVAFSPDSKVVVSGSWDNTVRLWDVVTGIVLHTLHGHSNGVSSVAFSPDSKVVVSGSWDKTVRLWDAATGVALQTLHDHSGPVNSVAFSPDSKVVVSGLGNETVRLWDAATGVALKTLYGHLYTVRSVAFSPDGKLVVSGSEDKTIRLWDAVTGAVLQIHYGHSDEVWSVAISPNGKSVVSGSSDKTIRLWDTDTATGIALRTLQGYSRRVKSVAFSPNKKLIVSGSQDGTVQLWDAVIRAAPQTVGVHRGIVSSVAFSPNGKIVASGSGDNKIGLSDTVTVTGAALKRLKGHLDTVNSVAFSPDGQQVVSGSWDHTVRVWDAVTGAALQTLQAFLSEVRSFESVESVESVAFSPDGQLVVSGSDFGIVRLWDTVTGAMLQTFKGHSDTVDSIAFSPDGQKVVSGSSYDHTVRLWDAVTGMALHTLEGHSSGVDSIAFLPGGKIVASLFLSENWIVEGQGNILWLPPDYRPSCVSICGRKIVIGNLLGGISFLEFKQGPKTVL